MAQGKRTVSDDEIIEKMNERADPAFTTNELADIFDMSAEGIRNRLKKLHKNGRVYRKKTGARTVLWWTENDQREPVVST